ncbi:MAG: TonB-dependent receptor [Bacteroidota bacterium]
MMKQLLSRNNNCIKKYQRQSIAKPLMLTLFSLFSFSVFSQSSIKGKVTGSDNTNEGLIGASIISKVTKNIVSTDSNGAFVINVASKDTLVFSYVGYKDKLVFLKDQSFVNVVLESNQEYLNEVVVVGYGTQKKINLTGAVSSISLKNIENRPITQASQALAGLTSGVIVSQGSGRPGNDGAGITIRGRGSYGAGGGALVLIDGISGSLNDVDPNIIKSISVLKDAASAAIYGSRAANGVILVETKRGQSGKMQLSYNSYVGWQKATALPDFVNSAEFAKLRNEANSNMGQSPAYTDAIIEKFLNQSDPDNYPNVPHLKNLLDSGSGFQTNHNLSFMWGNDKTKNLFSTSYLKQDGLVAENNYEKYNFTMNTDSKIKDNLTLKVNLMGYTAETNEPTQLEGGGSMTSIIRYAVREGPIFAGRKSDGSFGYQDNFSPEAWLDSNSFKKGSNKYFLGAAELSWEPIEGLNISGKVGYNFYTFYDKNYIAKVVFDQYKTVGPNNLNIYSGQGSQVTLQALASYKKTINDHNFTLLAGASQEDYVDSYLNAYRKDFPNNILYELNAASATGMSNSGSASEWAIRSYFGRLNYIFKERYLLEANIRTDGTSRFPSEGRWGVFPSFSAGWIISEESFLKNKLSWLNSLKIRGSWGELGNQNVGTYPYQNRVSLGTNYSFGGTYTAGASVNTTSNPNITWESTTTTDFGIDASFLDGNLGLVFDYFDKSTAGVLYSVASSSVLGMGTSPVNVGGVKNTGFEIALNYNKSFGDVNIGISPNFSYIKNEVTDLSSGLKQDINSNLFVGEPIGAIYGYVADGLFVDQSDINDYASQPYSPEPGFIRYKDISGPNGVPDGKVDATYDRKIIGSTTPQYTFGANINADYKGFDFSMLFSGLAGYKKRLDSYEAYAFYNGGQIQRWQVDNRWTAENPDRNAAYPKLTSLNGGSGTIMTSTYWLRNASFLRIKNLQVGYTLPEKLVKDKLKMEKLRFYVGGQNLLSINHFYQGWDPEMSNGNFYPITSTYTIGLNATF